jgi:hypothetical protein
MIGQYLSNNNENATVTFCQKIWHPNGALVSEVRFMARLETNAVRDDRMVMTD